MARLLVVELLEASNIPENIRHIRGLKVKPYIKAICPASEYEKQTSVAEKSRSGDGDQSTWRWETSFVMALQPVEVLGEVVVLSLFIQRSLKADKLVATLTVPVADFAVEDSSAEGASNLAGNTRTYEMKFERPNYVDKNGGTQITMNIRGRVEKNGPQITTSRPVGATSILRKGFRILSAAGTILGFEQTAEDVYADFR